ncbi:MAG: helicase HerA-like domain-containing protein [Xanthobacteraceae bacterium]
MEVGQLDQVDQPAAVRSRLEELGGLELRFTEERVGPLVLETDQLAQDHPRRCGGESAEQLSAAGVPVFAADIKGDLSGLATPGVPSDKLTERTASVGQTWAATGFPVEYYALGGQGTGIPLRVTMSAFGPILLSKVLGLNDTQESSLGLVFHYADRAGLPLLDLADLREVVKYLTSDEGKADLKDLGGLSSATAGVILRELITFSDQGADAFFGEPEFESSDLLQTTADGQGLISLVELPNLQDRPAVFSTFLMWLLADLFHDLPEVGDVDKPKLVFFFDEAHLLFNDAPKALLDRIEQVVRLIRSKGVGVYFVTQNPLDVPNKVLAQLGNRVQHALRAFTARDQKAVRAAAETFRANPGLDTVKVITELERGEALVSFLEGNGVPSPVDRALIRPPSARIGPITAEERKSVIAKSPIRGKYDQAIDPESVYEVLHKRVNERIAEETAPPPPSAPRRPPEQPSSGGGVLGDVLGGVLGGGTGRRSGRMSTTEVVVKQVARSVASQVGTQIGRALIRGLLGSLGGRR